MPTHSPVPGGVAVVAFDHAGDAPPKAWYRNSRVLVTLHNGRWQALVGLPLDASPGEHALQIERAGQRESIAFTVMPKTYPVQKLTIPDKRKVDPTAEDLKRIRAEQEITAKVRTHWLEADSVDLGFVLPADGPLSSRFGLRRVLNGQPRASHTGLDLVVPRGTPIKSVAAGTVTNTGDYFFAGKTVFVDHGQGLITMYCHLDEISVEPGTKLARGQRLGLSGMTGRVTGPHLHWSVYLNGAVIDPELFIRVPQNVGAAAKR